MFLKLLFETRVAHDMLCALEKIIMVEMSEKRQWRISRICDKITVFAKMFISQLSQWLWPPNLVEWWIIIRGSYPSNHSPLWSPNLPRSLNKLKSLNPHYHSACSNQTREDRDLLWEASSRNVIWSFDHMVVCLITWQTKNIISPLP